MNGSRNIIDLERTKNGVLIVVSLFSRDLVHTTMSCGRSWLGDEDLRGWLATTIGVTYGTEWSILILVLIMGRLARIVARLATLVAGSEDSAGSWVARWSGVEWSWRTRRHKGWPRWVVLAEHTVGNPDPALLRASTGRTIVSGVLAEISGGVHVLHLYGLVDKDLEGGEVMQVELTTESRIESHMEPLLFLGVSGDLFSSIASKSVKLTTKLVNGPPALGEVVELVTLVVHESFRNVMLTKSLTELILISG